MRISGTRNHSGEVVPGSSRPRVAGPARRLVRGTARRLFSPLTAMVTVLVLVPLVLASPTPATPVRWMICS